MRNREHTHRFAVGVEQDAIGAHAKTKACIGSGEGLHVAVARVPEAHHRVTHASRGRLIERGKILFRGSRPFDLQRNLKAETSGQLFCRHDVPTLGLIARAFDPLALIVT
jgi:hypothetical protein